MQGLRKILVAPFGLRERLIEHIRAVAKHGRDGRVRIKVNSLTDSRVIDALYAASQEGARVEIVARSICSLRPGVEGLSETIRVRSVLGRRRGISTERVAGAARARARASGTAPPRPF